MCRTNTVYAIVGPDPSLFFFFAPQDSVAEASHPKQPTACNPDATLFHMGLLHIGDGINKLAAAMISLIGHCLILEAKGPDFMQGEQIKDQLRSFLAINTVFLHHGSGSGIDNRVSSIVRQNQNAKVEQVSSLDWAVIMKEVAREGRLQNAEANVFSLEDAITVYKNHPDVKASTISTDGGDEAGGLHLGTTKLENIKKFYSDENKAIIKLMMDYQQVTSFRTGPVNEVMLNWKFLWAGSTAPELASNEDPAWVGLLQDLRKR
jgi:hypothetical protein